MGIQEPSQQEGLRDHCKYHTPTDRHVLPWITYAEMNIVSRIVAAARNLFAKGPLPAETYADRQRALLQLVTEVTPADLGFTKSQIPGSGGWQPYGGVRPVLYQHIYEDEAFSMGIFLVPQGSSLPLHDHPSMTVYSRVLFGSLETTSYTWTEGGSSPHGGLATRHFEGVVSAPDIAIAEPLAGNMHELICVSEE